MYWAVAERVGEAVARAVNEAEEREAAAMEVAEAQEAAAMDGWRRRPRCGARWGRRVGECVAVRVQEGGRMRISKASKDRVHLKI